MLFRPLALWSLLLLPLPSWGLGLGELALASVLGEPLQASVELRGASHWRERQISAVAVAQLPDLPAQRLTVTVAQSMAATTLLVSSATAIQVPLFAIELTVQAPAAQLQRRYTVALPLPQLSGRQTPPLQPLSVDQAAAPAADPVAAVPFAAASSTLEQSLAVEAVAPAAAAAVSPSELPVAAPAEHQSRPAVPLVQRSWLLLIALPLLLVLLVLIAVRYRRRAQAAPAGRAASAGAPSAGKIPYPQATPALQPRAATIAETATAAVTAESAAAPRTLEFVPDAAVAPALSGRRQPVAVAQPAAGAGAKPAPPPPQPSLAEQLADCYTALAEPQLAARVRAAAKLANEEQL